MENPNYGWLVGVAGVLVARWVLNRFMVKNRLLWFAVFIVVPGMIITSLVIIPRLIYNYAGLHSSTIGRIQFEDTIFKQYPAFRTIADKEPELWQKIIGEVVAVVQAHGNSPEVAGQVTLISKGLSDRLRKVAAAGDDDHIVKWTIAENILIDQLMRENVQMCVDRLLGTAYADYRTEPSPLIVRLRQQSQSTMIESYIVGLKVPIAMPAEEVIEGLLAEVMNRKEDPFTDDEIAILQSPSNQNEVDICRTYHKLYSSILNLGKANAANVMRFLLTKS